MVAKVKKNVKPVDFSIRGHFDIKIVKSAAHEHDLFHTHFKKFELEPAII